MKAVLISLLLLFQSQSSIAGETKFLAHVKDMTCPMCAAVVESEVKGIMGIKDIAIDIGKGTVIVTGTDLKKEIVSEAINKTRFKVTKIEAMNN